jgi:hypothetical protein
MKYRQVRGASCSPIGVCAQSDREHGGAFGSAIAYAKSMSPEGGGPPAPSRLGRRAQVRASVRCAIALPRCRRLRRTPIVLGIAAMGARPRCDVTDCVCSGALARRATRYPVRIERQYTSHTGHWNVVGPRGRKKTRFAAEQPMVLTFRRCGARRPLFWQRCRRRGRPRGCCRITHGPDLQRWPPRSATCRAGPHGAPQRRCTMGPAMSDAACSLPTVARWTRRRVRGGLQSTDRRRGTLRHARGAASIERMASRTGHRVSR